MSAILDLLKSERGIAFLALVIAATVLAALGHITFVEWQDYTKVLFVGYVAAKSITGAVDLATHASRTKADTEATVAGAAIASSSLTGGSGTVDAGAAVKAGA